MPIDRSDADTQLCVHGTRLAAWLQGRAAKMNAAAVFIGVVFWGALWGVWGLLLGPALVVVHQGGCPTHEVGPALFELDARLNT